MDAHRKPRAVRAHQGFQGLQAFQGCCPRYDGPGNWNPSVLIEIDVGLVHKAVHLVQFLLGCDRDGLQAMRFTLLLGSSWKQHVRGAGGTGGVLKHSWRRRLSAAESPSTVG